MVWSGSGKVKEPENPKEVESVADEVADKIETVDEVVEKIKKSVVESKPVEAVPDKVADKVDTVEEVVNKKSKEEGPWNRLVQSDSLGEPDEKEEKTPELVPKEEALEPAPALATKSTYNELVEKDRKRKDKSKRKLQEFAPNDQVWAQDPTIASGFWAMDPTTKKWSIKASII